MIRDRLALLPVFIAAPLLRHWHMRWGASAIEGGAPMPGDDIVASATVSTRAITINAPPETVWPWLVQMGQDRAGFYSYDWLERLAGANIHNSKRIVQEWQSLKPGDLVRTYRYIQRFEPLGWTVVRVDANRSLVVKSRTGKWSWSLLLKPEPNGSTRLLARTRSEKAGLPTSLAGALTGEPMHFVMEVGVLRGIKHRAETMNSSPEAFHETASTQPQSPG